ncbi:hypothetical protein I3760_11G123300 [Carya illinoinensis]|nr:hypothetical protein I3760_11G123300 [Carya illinoinensis]
MVEAVNRTSIFVVVVFKAKYFSNVNFLHASSPRKSSYVWRSIFAFKKILCFGCMWNVGKGDKVRIMLDRWLPMNVQLLPQSPQHSIQSHTTIDYLLMQNLSLWNRELVFSIFPANVVISICSLPLLSRQEDDRVMWLGNKNGTYSVKLGNYLALNLFSQNDGPEALI